MTNAERGQIQAEVLAWSDQFLAAVNNRDAQGVALLFDQADGHFIDVGSYLPNWSAFLTSTQELYAGWESWNGAWETRRIDVLAPDAALFVGEAVGMLKPREGGELDHRTDFSFVVRKKDGVWTGLFGHVSGSWTARE
jgi:uncharacterized protein (TIGR02246 family)